MDWAAGFHPDMKEIIMRIANKLAIFCIALLTAGLAQAGEQGEVSGYDALDSNQDGQISRAEAQAEPGLEEQWDELDVDRSGGLSEAEFARFEAEGDTGAEGQTQDEGQTQEQQSPGGYFD